ncbi:MAG TPA: carbohydrate kinase family protein [Fimbriimonas sp.]|nr:carbohydrate kinase family protein [Fimbriimonas sp.]
MVLVFGTVCLDRVMRVPRLPEPGGYVAIESEAVYLGGEAANTANALKNWGVEVDLVCNELGSGHDGEVLQALLQDRALDTQRSTLTSRTPICDIYVTPDGERTMFGRGFSDMEPEMSVDEIRYRSGHWFTAEPNMSVVSRQAALLAKRYGMKLYLMDFYRDDDPIGPGDIWQCSTDWVGQRGDTAANIEWVKQWVDLKGCSAILTDGPRGLVYGAPDFPAKSFPPFPAPAIVDSTGAGDTFRAGTLYGLEAGWPILKCLAFGSAAGALECGYIGATTQVPTVEEVATHIEEHPRIAEGFLNRA